MQLQKYWTYKRLPEYSFVHDVAYPNGTLAQHVLLEGNNTLWVGAVVITLAPQIALCMVALRTDNVSGGWLNPLYSLRPVLDGCFWCGLLCMYLLLYEQKYSFCLRYRADPSCMPSADCVLA